MRCFSYSSSITMRTESEPRSIAQLIAYRGVAEEAVGLEPLAECHTGEHVVVTSELITTPAITSRAMEVNQGEPQACP